jgi:magnesium-transporting ATPase (P-type)
MFMMFFSPLLESSPMISVIGLMAVVLAVFVLARRQGRLPWNPSPRDNFRAPRPPYKPLDIPRFEIPRIGKWVIMPTAIIGVIAFILFQNWWLNVSILRSMYDLKAGLDWWSIQFLNNHYFNACLCIGLLIALSDPRISITRDVDGEKRIYLHSQLLGALKVVSSARA